MKHTGRYGRLTDRRTEWNQYIPPHPPQLRCIGWWVVGWWWWYSNDDDYNDYDYNGDCDDNKSNNNDNHNDNNYNNTTIIIEFNITVYMPSCALSGKLCYVSVNIYWKTVADVNAGIWKMRVAMAKCYFFLLCVYQLNYEVAFEPIRGLPTFLCLKKDNQQNIYSRRTESFASMAYNKCYHT